MRHGNKTNSLGRTAEHRKAMLANMASSLIEHKRINTTVAKAKALRKYMEPLVTKSKTDSTHSRRVVFSYLQNKEAVTELFRTVAPKVADRPGGYLRIIRIGNRLGDNAEMCMIEFVDFNELMTKDTQPAKKTTRRSRRGGSAKKADNTQTGSNSTSDYATVNFSEDHELNYHLKKHDLSQSIANRAVLVELGTAFKAESDKKILTHEEVDELITKNIDKFATKGEKAKDDAKSDEEE